MLARDRGGLQDPLQYVQKCSGPFQAESLMEVKQNLELEEPVHLRLWMFQIQSTLYALMCLKSCKYCLYYRMNLIYFHARDISMHTCSTYCYCSLLYTLQMNPLWDSESVSFLILSYSNNQQFSSKPMIIM